MSDTVRETIPLPAIAQRRLFALSTIGAPVTFAQAGLAADTVDLIAENAFCIAKLWGMDQLYPQHRIAEILKLAVR